MARGGVEVEGEQGEDRRGRVELGHRRPDEVGPVEVRGHHGDRPRHVAPGVQGAGEGVDDGDLHRRREVRRQRVARHGLGLTRPTGRVQGVQHGGHDLEPGGIVGEGEGGRRFQQFEPHRDRAAQRVGGRGAQGGDGVGVTGFGAEGEMACHHGGRRAGVPEGDGGVAMQGPARRRGQLVHEGETHQIVAEGPAVAGVHDEAGAAGVVERIEQLSDGSAGDGGEVARAEAAAEEGGELQQPKGVGGQKTQLVQHRFAQGQGHGGVAVGQFHHARRRLQDAVGPEGAQETEEVERVAGAAGEMGAQPRSGSDAEAALHQLVDGVAGEGLEPHHGSPGRADLLQAQLEIAPLGRRPGGDGQQDREGGHGAGQPADHRHRPGVGPVDVLEHHDHGLVGGGGLHRVGEGVGHHQRAVGHDEAVVGPQRGEQGGALEGSRVFGEGGHGAERPLGVHLVGPPDGGAKGAGVGGDEDVGEEAGLADARFTGDHQGATPTFTHVAKQLLGGLGLRRPTDEPVVIAPARTPSPHEDTAAPAGGGLARRGAGMNGPWPEPCGVDRSASDW